MAFLEAGSSWVPFVLQETFRADESGVFRSFKDWRIGAAAVFLDQQLFVAAQMDDDLPYLLGLTGPDHLVYGTDFGHLDLGSDPTGLHIVAARSDLDPAVARRIVDANGRRLYGIESLLPAGPTAERGRCGGAAVGITAVSTAVLRVGVIGRGFGARVVAPSFEDTEGCTVVDIVSARDEGTRCPRCVPGTISISFPSTRLPSCTSITCEEPSRRGTPSCAISPSGAPLRRRRRWSISPPRPGWCTW